MTLEHPTPSGKTVDELEKIAASHDFVDFKCGLEGNTFPVMDLQIGGVPPDQLLQRVKGVCNEVDRVADTFMRDMKCLPNPVTIKQIRIRVGQISLPDAKELSEINERNLVKEDAWMDAWSERNLDGWVIERNSAEAIAHLATSAILRPRESLLIPGD